MAEAILQRARELARDDSWMERLSAERSIVADLMWLCEQKRLEAARTTEPRITIDNEPYKRLQQESTCLYHGLWGAHVVDEPLYRREGVRNGPTIHPLDLVVGVVDGSLLPDLALAAGGLAAVQTTPEVEATLERLGFHPPSRTTLKNRLDGLYADMATTARELEAEAEVRVEEELDFELGSISCGLDRFSARMRENLADGPKREAKLAAQHEREYQRTPVEPYECNWRMAWAGNVTFYDTDGAARRTLRFGADADADVDELVARMIDEIIGAVECRRDIPVVSIQDGAAEFEALPRALRERLPEGVPRWQLVDFHHAVAYLDAVIVARDDGDPYDMRRTYRNWLLDEDDGAQRVVRHLRREAEKSDLEPAVATATHAALTYFEKRRPLMKYKAARQQGMPIGSGATESTCALYQLRVKHPGSQLHVPGLRGVITARGLQLSGRFDAAFLHYQATLRADVAPL
ncbi:hypothetical protein [Enhygromyxa salina]|nr:hypothetical protein [Enhygromyxa salina]